ncbi:ABC transporter permease [Mesorhizobium delmotii]|uniref:Ribose transport system permease protein RbsC n=1 Tax=Mesorhizobium delmotii TaxID=1631247 RepID=A0A2P9AMC6_9HYPH|nr:ABC transporter permease [Mesorhizobium delmotii]SJM32286.1 Ribose transport system permease protein RbsC [Mesorhizobium delmotii]
MSVDEVGRWPSRFGSRVLRRFVETRELTLLVLIVAIIVGMSLASPVFLSLANFRAIAIGMAPTVIIAVGMTVLLVSGGFDLSVGSVLALASTVTALLLLSGASIPLAILGALALGVIIGLANGIVVTRIGVNPLVATLGSMSIARGIALVLTEGFSLSNLPPAFGWAGRAEILGLPFLLWVALALVVVFDLAMRHGSFFRQLYYIGSNEKAARLSGLAVNRVRTLAYMLSGLLAALAGVLLASRLMSGTPTAGNALELQVLAAAVIGGASLRGGEGTVVGAFLGVIFVALINNAMTMLAVSIYWQMIVTGAVLVLAVALDMLVRRGDG